MATIVLAPRPGARDGRGVRRARGFSLVSAVFLLVVLMVLGVSLVTIASVQHATAAQQLQALRATYAVRAGIDWAARQGAGCPSSSSLTFPGLPGFNVVVNCSTTVHLLDGTPRSYVVVDATATSTANYGGPDFVRRRGQAKVLQ